MVYLRAFIYILITKKVVIILKFVSFSDFSEENVDMVMWLLNVKMYSLYVYNIKTGRT